MNAPSSDGLPSLVAALPSSRVRDFQQEYGRVDGPRSFLDLAADGEHVAGNIAAGIESVLSIVVCLCGFDHDEVRRLLRSVAAAHLQAEADLPVRYPRDRLGKGMHAMAAYVRFHQAAAPPDGESGEQPGSPSPPIEKKLAQYLALPVPGIDLGVAATARALAQELAVVAILRGEPTPGSDQIARLRRFGP